MINILISGCNGKMGQTVARIVGETEGVQVVAGIDIDTAPRNGFPVFDSFARLSTGLEEGVTVDVLIDFSHPSTLDGLLSYAKSTGMPAVICTTGLSKEQVQKIGEYSKDVPIFFSANMSIGVNLLIDLVKRASKVLEENFDIEIVEKHHNLKLDAPSGTALAIADAIADSVSYNPEYVYDRHSVRRKRGKHEIGLHAVRGGTIVGEHSVIFAGYDEVIEINHSAASKEVFAIGAVRAAKFMAGKGAGLYTMRELIMNS